MLHIIMSMRLVNPYLYAKSIDNFLNVRRTPRYTYMGLDSEFIFFILAYYYLFQQIFASASRDYKAVKDTRRIAKKIYTYA